MRINNINNEQDNESKTYFENKKYQTNNYYEKVKSAVEKDRINTISLLQFIQRPEILAKIDRLPANHIVNITTTPSFDEENVYDIDNYPITVQMITPQGSKYCFPFDSYREFQPQTLEKWLDKTNS